ncbi:hypothetical protein TNCV_2339451 [Trichonephila clavipes]|nr:hypothetical protein TNCV_2339451 [Trichonephila clavipes]
MTCGRSSLVVKISDRGWLVTSLSPELLKIRCAGEAWLTMSSDLRLGGVRESCRARAFTWEEGCGPWIVRHETLVARGLIRTTAPKGTTSWA